MILKTQIRKSFYQDSVVLMRVAATLREREGVGDAAAFMGTPSNLEILDASGLATGESAAAGPNDLIIVVKADDAAEAEAALAQADELLARKGGADGAPAETRPRTLDTALRQLPEANLAVISVPGAHAEMEAMRALRRGLHVFLFSDNVPVAAEIALKREAIERNLLCMGPDCGTAYVNGTGLGFFNAVPRGRIGCVAASGTGLQAVACSLAALGEGISHGIGVGGRDLTAAVGGVMTLFAVEALAADSGTDVIVIISKPAAPVVMKRLAAALTRSGKPSVICCIGAPAADTDIGNAVRASTLDDGAGAAAALRHGRPWQPRAFTDPAIIRSLLGQVKPRAGKRILGLYTGGTLAHESHGILDRWIGSVGSNLGYGEASGRHTLIDLGDDAYTIGRPHPMIEPETRLEVLRRQGGDGDVGVLLFDLVLGTGSHRDPAAGLATEFGTLRAAAETSGRRLVAVASIVGTDGDPQNLSEQAAALEAAGMVVLPSNAEAARFAAMLIAPESADRMMKETR